MATPLRPKRPPRPILKKGSLELENSVNIKSFFPKPEPILKIFKGLTLKEGRSLEKNPHHRYLLSYVKFKRKISQIFVAFFK